MAKAKSKPIQTTVDAPTVNAVVEDFNSNGHLPAYEIISIDALAPSSTNPRKRFPEASLADLAGSIREKGVLEPLIVRLTQSETAKGGSIFEIVCGERRYRAAMQAGLIDVPCMVRDLTDTEVLDIQIHENLHREDVHPMDEAFGYKFLMEQIGCDVAEVALRVGKSESYVLNRLKLNQLIPEVQKDIEDGFLTLSIGLEIAKYSPDGQRLIYDELYEDRNWDGKLQKYTATQDTDKSYGLAAELRTPHEIAEWASTNVLHLLAKAPFDKKSTNLRQDGLACINCPNRTGANASLFESQIGKKDSCLDPGCYNEKIKTHIHITRHKIAHEASVDVSEVPIIKTFHGSGGKDSNGTEYLGQNDFEQLTGPRAGSSVKKCKSAVTAIDIDTSQDTYAKPVEVCLRSSGCKVHWNGAKQIPNSASKAIAADARDPQADEAARIARAERKEEIFDIAVAEIVRRRVFRLAADQFAVNSGKFVDRLGELSELLTKLWLTSNNGDDGQTLARLIQPMMRDITDSPDGFKWSTWVPYGKTASDSDAAKGIAALSNANQSRLLFLFVHGNKGHCYYDKFRSQKEVRELATEFDLNYKLFDAEARVEVAGTRAKKHLDEFKRYLNLVEAGAKQPLIPRPWADTYKPKE